MKIILLSIILLSSLSFSDVAMRRSETKHLSPEELQELEENNRRTRPTIRHITTPMIIQDNHYYTNQVSSCDKYLDVISKQSKEIAILKSELFTLRAQEQVRLQKVLKAKHTKEIEKFENRKSNVKRKNSIIISKEPLQ